MVNIVVSIRPAKASKEGGSPILVQFPLLQYPREKIVRHQLQPNIEKGSEEGVAVFLARCCILCKEYRRVKQEVGLRLAGHCSPAQDGERSGFQLARHALRGLVTFLNEQNHRHIQNRCFLIPVQ